MTDNKNSYDKNAEFWVKIIRENRDRYRTDLTDQALLTAVGDPHGLVVLDAGCGEGYMSRALAERGAKVTGIDFSAELIKAAKTHERMHELPISFDVGSVNGLPYGPNTFDLVLCNHLLNDLEDPAGAIKEFSRVLSEDGRIIILMLHPCLYTARAKRDQADNDIPASTYFQTRSVSQNFVVDGLQSPVPVTAWLRPLEFYTKALEEAGFAITSLTEPHPSEELLRGDDWWQAGFTLPLFLLVVAQRWTR